MGRPQQQSAEASTLWLAKLIEAMNEVGASQSQACESSVLTAFVNRLTLPAMPVSHLSNSRHEEVSNYIPVKASPVSASPFRATSGSSPNSGSAQGDDNHSTCHRLAIEDDKTGGTVIS